MIIKVFLVASVLLAGWWLLRGRPTGSRLAVTRVGGLLVALGWLAMVLVPHLAANVAHRVGVKEAPNLVLYLLVVVFTFTTISQRIRVNDLEERIARLTRAQALAEIAGNRPSDVEDRVL